MKILHVLGGYYPDPMAGTEIYVQSLALELQAHGIENVIAAPGNTQKTYEHTGLRIRRYSMSPESSRLDEAYGTSDKVALEAFLRLVKEEQPNIVHFHTRTRAASLDFVRRLKSIGITTVITYHTPTMSCPRGTLLRWGNEICDGEIRERKCTQCMLTGLGLSTPISRALSAIPSEAGKLIGRLGVSGSAWTALRMREMIEVFASTARAYYREADCIIALCDWAQNVLINNGISTQQIHVVRHGISGASPNTPIQGTDPRMRTPIKLIFLGRIEPVKGLHRIVEALKNLPSANVNLDIYSVPAPNTSSYRRAIEDAVHADNRIRFLDSIPNEKVLEVLSKYDALVVPSEWLETGPLVVLEAFAAGIPVLGSRLGGIAELVTDGVDGILVDPFSDQAWHACLQRINDLPEILDRLRAKIRPPRSMRDVAAEMTKIYQDVVQWHHA